jgi:predicted secreted acid phosphatase
MFGPVTPSAPRTVRLATLLLLATSTITFSSCASPQAGTVPNLYEAQEDVEHYIDSGSYEADFTRVAHEAQTYLEEHAKLVTRPAIVLDIDETSLSNWPAYKANGWSRIVNGECDIERGPCGLRAWQESGRAMALKPTLDLDRRAKVLGVAVFFISARPPNLREATEKNLREQGFDWDEVILLPQDASFANGADFKAPERKRIAEHGYTILLTMGDQQSDLSGGYAERTYKLPNPVYLIP